MNFHVDQFQQRCVCVNTLGSKSLNFKQLNLVLWGPVSLGYAVDFIFCVKLLFIILI